MKTPHKHAALIKAWADGARIEYWSKYSNEWAGALTPAWDPNVVYRIKPEPKPDIVKYVNVHRSADMYPVSDKIERYSDIGVMFDGETGLLKRVWML